MARIGTALLALLVPVAPVLAETVRFKTADGIEIVADYVAGKKNAASVICIPMYRHTRDSYLPLLPLLKEKGFHVLMVDKRGHGDSAPDLAERVRARDPKLFNAMHADVEAAMEFLEREKGCDATRIGLVGGSVGCSVAVDVTVRNPHAIRAVVLLTPGSNYLGVPTLKHLERWPGTRLFLFTSSEEQKTSQGVIDALKPFDGTNYIVLPGKGIHGTRMFNKVPAIEQTIANFLESSLKDSADVRVPQWKPGDKPDPKRALRLRRKVGERTYSFLLHAVGDRWTLGAAVDRPFEGTVRLTVDGEESEIALDAPVTRTGLKAYTKLSLEFRHSKGKRVRLPAAGSYAAILQPVDR